MVEFMTSWWGLLLVVIAVIFYGIYDWQSLKTEFIGLMMLAEKEAKQRLLKTGSEKFQWVLDNGYQKLPLWLRVWLSEEAFALILQKIYDNIFNKLKDSL